MKTIKAIKEEFEQADMALWPEMMKAYSEDTRSGLVSLMNKLKKQILKAEEEDARLESMLSFEKQYGEDYHAICGIDEAGRGPLAGPVVAAAVILPVGLKIPKLNDSKQLSEKTREALYDIIMDKALSVGIGIIDHELIDEINILQADYEAMRQAVSQLDPVPDLLLNDAVTIPGLPQKQLNIIKGDAKSLSIAAASVIAKVTRDRLMKQYDELYPEYGFAKNKGYGSQAHIEAIKAIGPSPIHRKTFIKNFI